MANSQGTESGEVVQIDVLENTGDHRGDSFSRARAVSGFIQALEDVHLMTVRPNCERGKHFHAEKHEILVVHHSDRWSFEWDSGEGTDRQVRRFDGAGAVLIRIPPGCWHDLHNEGSVDLTLIGLSDREFDAARPDIYPRDREVLAGS